MIDDEFFWIFSSCCMLDLFLYVLDLFLCFCVHSIIYSSKASGEAVLFLFEKILSQKKTKKRKERNTKRPKNVHVSLVFFIRVVHPKYLAPLKILFLVFDLILGLSVSRFSITPTQREPQKTTRAPV